MPIESLPLSNNFEVEIPGIGVFGFSELEGIEQCINITKYREGNMGTDEIIQIPGSIKYGNVTVKRVAGNTNTGSAIALLDWFNSINQCQQDNKRKVIITIRSCNGAPSIYVNLYNAWPFKYEFSKLDALSNEVLLNTLMLTFERMEIIYE